MSRFGPVLRLPDFRALWGAAVVSGLGDRIATIALYLLIYHMTGSAVNLGMLAAAQIVPAIVLGPVTGLLLDRYDRKSLMVASDLMSALVVATIPLASTPAQVYLLAALLACGRQLTGPARLALMPDVVPAAHLSSANGLLMVTRNVVLLAGPALGGLIVAWRGTDPAFWLDAVTFLASAAILVAHPFAAMPAGGAEPAPIPRAAAAAAGGDDLTVVPPPPDIPAVGTGAGERFRRALGEVREGLQSVLDRPRLRFAFLFFAALTFVTAMQQPLVVVFVEEILGRGEVALGIVVSAAGFGGVIGALAGGLRFGERRPLVLVLILTALDGGLLVVFALNRLLWLAVLLFALFGAIGTLAQIALATFLQRETPEASRGRTFGWLGTVVGPLSLVSVFLGPLAAEILGVVAVLALSGVFELVVAVAGGFSLRRLVPRGPGLAPPVDGS